MHQRVDIEARGQDKSSNGNMGQQVPGGRHKSRHILAKANKSNKMYSFYSTVTLIAILAFQATSHPVVLGQQQEGHEQASAAPMGPLAAGEANSGPLVDSAGAIAVADDLLAAESSQSPEAEAHKAFTSAQVLRQEQATASVAPAIYGPPQAPQGGPQQQPMFHHPQQQHPPQHMQGARFQPQPQQPQAHPHHPHPKAAPHLNPFMAAALAGNYGPAQQQMAAAALHAQQQAHQIHHAQQHGPPAVHPQHQQQPHHAMPQQQMAPPPPHQQQLAAAPHPSLHQPQAQAQTAAQQQPQLLAVQESNIRHNIVPAPALESNTIELSESSPAGPAPPQQQQQQSTQLAVASSAQHPVIAPASSGVGSASQQEAWPLQAPDIPKIVNLEVKCEKNLMKVSVEFDKIFNGVIFSKGHFNQGQCVHVGPNSSKQQAYFDISINSCGTQGNTQNGLYGMGQNTGSGTFFENTIVIQYDPNVQEVYDHARKLRCTWHDQYEKAVTFRPFPVDMLDIVRADFAGDNVGCWMQIQVGKGPWASEVAGIVKIGQTMTMVLAIKDEENKFDMLVRNCFAHDGKRGPIELVDKSGCITRPKLMSRFTKIKNFGSSATVLSYAHFQAFKFPDSMEVHFQCTIQICRHQCPEQCSAGPGAIGGSSSSGPIGSGPGGAGEAYSESTISGTFNIHSGSQAAGGAHDSAHLRKFGSAALSRERRSAEHQAARWSNGSHHHHNHHAIKPLTQSVGLNRIIQVVSTGDLAFAVNNNKEQRTALGGDSDEGQPLASSLTSKLDLTDNQICMSSYNFVLALVCLVLILLCSCLSAISLYIRQKSLLSNGQGKLRSSSSSTMNRQLIHTPSPQTTPPPPQQNNCSQHQYIHTNVPTQSQYYTERR